MSKKRKLSDLYVRGRDITLNDGEGDPVTVYIQKLSPLDHENALRKSNALRARLMATIGDPESEEYQSTASQVYDMTRDSILDFLATDELDGVRYGIEDEAASEEPWSDEDYLQGLRDDWDETLAQRYLEDPEDADAVKVLAELTKFKELVEKRIERERIRLREEFDARPMDRLQALVVERWLRVRANVLWLNEFRKCQIWRAVRDPENHKVYYFESREEVDEVPEAIMDELLAAYSTLEVDVLEGKDLQETPDSSQPSEPAKTPEMEDSSSPKVSAA